MDDLKELDDLFSEHFGLQSTTEKPIEVDDDNESWDCDESFIDERTRIEKNIQELIDTQTEERRTSGDGVEPEGAACGPGGDADQQLTVSADSDIETDECASRCKCSFENPCLESFDDIDDHILDIREMSRNEKEMLIMGALMPFDRKKTWRGDRQRHRYSYTYRGVKICRECFKHVYDVGNWTLKTIMKHIQTNGRVPRVHGNIRKRPHNALTYEQVRHCVDFIDRQGEEFGWPMPTPPRGRDEIPPVYLPASFTKKSMFTEYSQGCRQLTLKSVGLTSFKNIWSQCVPHIKIATPRDDVCQKCELISKQVQAATTEDGKLQATHALQDHITHAQSEREFYRRTLERAQAETPTVREMGPVPPCSTEYMDIHYTFDFSQLVSIPHHFRQMGPLYFVTPRKVQLFGVRDDGGARQYNYLIDENESIGTDGSLCHGPNAVLSMLDHSLTYHGYGEKRCVLHCDNCFGQNKNRFTMAYLCWRVMVGLHEEIDLHMQVPGHTRCNVDAGFAHIKKLYRRTDVDCFKELVALVNRSATSNKAVTFKTNDGEERWNWRDWKSFLSALFKPLPGVSKYFHFSFRSTNPGYVFMKVKATDDVEIRRCLLDSTQQLDVYARPTILHAAGLSVERQRYLHKSVRPMVRPECQDITCPPV